jgi:hypothetical protein
VRTDRSCFHPRPCGDEALKGVVPLGGGRLVNVGSGVNIVEVRGPKQFQRVSGSSLGGSTFYGLCSLMTQLASFEEMLDSSKDGDLGKVDMLVRKGGRVTDASPVSRDPSGCIEPLSRALTTTSPVTSGPQEPVAGRSGTCTPAAIPGSGWAVTSSPRRLARWVVSCQATSSRSRSRACVPDLARHGACPLQVLMHKSGAGGGASLWRNLVVAVWTTVWVWLNVLLSLPGIRQAADRTGLAAWVRSFLPWGYPSTW